MESGIVVFLKKEGELLNELVERVRLEKNIDEKTSITYAGRLDPMASGLMLLLVGENVYDKDSYLKTQKTYEVEMLFGISSDTQDALGKISGDFHVPIFDEIKNTILKFPKKYDQEYPMYSSKPVDGIPLFTHARNNKAVEIPKHEVSIHEITIKNSREISGKELAEKAIERVGRVHGDFRQNEIIESWKNFEKDFGEKKFLIVNVEVVVEGGTYVRTLTRDIGRSVGTDAIAWKIVRIKVGEYFL